MQKLTNKNINQIFEVWQKNNPNPKTELSYVNHYTLLVAVVLSAQSTDVGVNKATKKLFEIVDSPQKMLELGEEKLKKHINTIGLFNAKAKNVILLSKQLVEKHNSIVPNNFNDLINLAGVGQKTANVILNCAFNKPTIAVDTHVFRVSNRLGFANEKTPEKTEIAILKTIPKKWQNHAHHWMILHGRYICKAQKPLCKICEINEFCNFSLKT